MPTSKEIMTFNNSIQTAVEAAGATPKFALGRTTRRNDEFIAIELYAARKATEYAEARYKRAVSSAIEAGVMFDHKKEPKSDGTNLVYFVGDNVTVSLLVKAGAQRLNAEDFVANLVKLGVKKEIVDKAMASATKKSVGAHTFTPALVQKD